MEAQRRSKQNTQLQDGVISDNLSLLSGLKVKMKCVKSFHTKTLFFSENKITSCSKKCPKTHKNKRHSAPKSKYIQFANMEQKEMTETSALKVPYDAKLPSCFPSKKSLLSELPRNEKMLLNYFCLLCFSRKCEPKHKLLENSPL